MGTHYSCHQGWLRSTDSAYWRNDLNIVNPNTINYVPAYVQAWVERLESASPQPTPELLERLHELRDELDWGFNQGDNITGLLHGWAAGVDGALRQLWRKFGLDQHPDIALIAVGGYGRKELHPGSDIDLLILLKEDESQELGEALSQFVTILWDLKLDIGQSVRTLQECTQEAANDLTIMTNLLESRVLIGSQQLFDDLNEQLWSPGIWSTTEFYKAKLEEQESRRARYGDTGYRLEPNIKESPGGLRDFQLVKWLAIRHFSTNTLAEVVAESFLRESEYRALLSCRDHLWRVRYALHYISGKKEDRLLFDYQHQLAVLFGYKHEVRNKGTEAFMREYYRTVMTLERLTEMVLQMFAKAMLKEQPKEKPNVTPDFVLANGYLDVVDRELFQRKPEALLSIFLMRIRTPECKQIGVKSIRLIHEHLHLIDQSFRDNRTCRKIFMDIFREKRGVTKALRSMNSYGVLGRYLPQFDAITGLMQFDMFHIFTVDEHTMMVLRSTRRFTLPENKEEHPEGYGIFQELPKPELLYLAAIFHDIAKGRGGDHAILGAEDARKFCRDHGLSTFDSELVAWLVEKHLVMSMTAQRKDISDIDVIREFATQVETPLKLQYLYLLTICDIRGTNPTLWNDWKSNLLSSLYHRTMQWLTQVTSGAVHLTQAEFVRDTRLIALRSVAQSELDERDVMDIWEHFTTEYFRRYEPDEIVWHTRMLMEHERNPEQKVFVTSDAEHGATEILIYAPAHPGFFMQATRGIEQLGLNIVAAKVYSTMNDRALDTFSVLEDDGKPCEGEYRLEEIRDRLNVLINNPDQTPPQVKKALPRRLKSFDIPAQITFSNNDEWKDTLLDLSVPDYPGLLADVATILYEQGFGLKLARIATVSEQAQDILHIHTPDERPLSLEQQELLRTSLLEVINKRSGSNITNNFELDI